MATSGTPPSQPSAAGWYPDPEQRFEQRFWDGSAWTSAAMQGGEVTADPLFRQSSPAAGQQVPADKIAAQMSAAPMTTALGWAGPGAFRTSMPPDVASREIAQRLAYVPVVVTFAAPDQVQGTISTQTGSRTNVALAVLLLLFCIIPGIIYLIVSSSSRMRHTPFTLVLMPQGSGTVITAQPPWVANSVVGNVLRSLPQ